MVVFNFEWPSIVAWTSFSIKGPLLTDLRHLVNRSTLPRGARKLGRKKWIVDFPESPTQTFLVCGDVPSKGSE